MYSAASSLRTALGNPIEPTARAAYEHDLRVAEANLGPVAYAAAWAEGRAMPLETAIAAALEGVPVAIGPA